MPTGIKNFGPCLIINCTNANVKFRTITTLAYKKCYTKQTLKDYPYLEVGKQLCHSHYCKLVEPNEHRFKKKVQKESILETTPIDIISNDVLEPINPDPNDLINNNSFASSIDMLTKALYYQQRHEGTGLELDPNNFHVYNIDDYHSIHENRRPDTVSCTTANHFATCVAKPILGCSSVPLVFNGVSVHNPENVEAPRICWYLLHRYADNIEERKEERSIKDVQLLGFKEQDLHSVQDYTNVLNLILSINNKTHHLDEQVAPIIADWPGQIFIRKALHMRTLPEFQSLFPQQIESFLPILGPLHISLNSREQVIMNHLTSFNEYYVENVHSKIQANTSQNTSVDSIIKQTYFIMNHDPTFINTYCKTRRYPYTINTLNFLYDKTALFLIQHFQSIFNNRGRNEKFLTRIKKGENKLTKENLDEGDNDNIESREETSEEVEEIDVSPRLIAEINQIEHW
ncbi:hypothetical protein C2G38_2166665 [Gigaspora rosea]|uniref:Uncharacterized protein n=1 Tax=Gigaspora rosea TaxID=44941 RepID=A0A397VTP5_9GLOM|nr:hypothetical protein C2G38_2166665 [Gigaspora rosea]